MDRLQSQMRELVKCQATGTKKFVEDKLANFIGVKDFNMEELKHTLSELKLALDNDEDTLKIINGIIDTNKNKLTSISSDVEALKITQKTLGDNYVTANRNIKECRRVIEEDMVLNISELCSIFNNELNSNSSVEEL